MIREEAKIKIALGKVLPIARESAVCPLVVFKVIPLKKREYLKLSKTWSSL